MSHSSSDVAITGATSLCPRTAPPSAGLASGRGDDGAADVVLRGGVAGDGADLGALGRHVGERGGAGIEPAPVTAGEGDRRAVAEQVPAAPRPMPLPPPVISAPVPDRGRARCPVAMARTVQTRS
jgi:hypothetical protein